MSKRKDEEEEASLDNVEDTEPEELRKKGKELREEGYITVESIVPIDELFENRIGILYAFANEEGDLRFLRTEIDRVEPEIDSLTPIFNSSYWHEQEMHELFGINFREHPDQSYLLLRDDWPGGYPHRKDYVVEPAWESHYGPLPGQPGEPGR